MKKKILKIDKNVKIVFVKDRPGHDTRYALNSKKIKKKLKWKAVIELNEGLTKTIDWYINNQKFFKSISEKKYMNRLGLKI
jgi:dTDP-glucose 4,6-dehydratase